MTWLVKQIPVAGVIFMIVAMNALGVTNIIFGTLFQQLPSANMIGRVNTVNLSLMAVESSVGLSFRGHHYSSVRFNLSFFFYVVWGIY